MKLPVQIAITLWFSAIALLVGMKVQANNHILRDYYPAQAVPVKDKDDAYFLRQANYDYSPSQRNSIDIARTELQSHSDIAFKIVRPVTDGPRNGYLILIEGVECFIRCTSVAENLNATHVLIKLVRDDSPDAQLEFQTIAIPITDFPGDKIPELK